MNMKKLLPIILLVIMAVVAISVKQCKKNNSTTKTTTRQNNIPPISSNRSAPSSNNNANRDGLDRNPDRLFYSKHARCRMKCRHITQEEVKEILVDGTINYNKSELQDQRGPKYAVEGNTHDGQHVRIIFAPNTQHINVVTVIDLEEDYACSCD